MNSERLKGDRSGRFRKITGSGRYAATRDERAEARRILDEQEVQRVERSRDRMRDRVTRVALLESFGRLKAPDLTGQILAAIEEDEGE